MLESISADKRTAGGLRDVPDPVRIRFTPRRLAEVAAQASATRQLSCCCRRGAAGCARR
jgi:hypothetical protein